MKRNLYLKTMTADAAYKLYVDVLLERNILKRKTEIIKTEDSLGRRTNVAHFAKCNSPLFTASAMDGICVDSKITKNASEENPVILKLGVDYKIVDTGDVIKSPYDAVIMAEDVIEIDEQTVKIIEPAVTWQNVRPIGEDIVEKEMIIPSNHKITAIDIGALMASGNLELSVYKKTSVGIIPTGDEIINPVDKPKEGDIIDSNSYMIKALVNSCGAYGKRYEIVKDDLNLIKEAIKRAVSENDIVIINAGSSAGTEDFSKTAIKELGEIFVHGVSIKPGKPVMLGIIDNKPIIGLPGYPLSTYLAFDIFVKPILDYLNNSKNILEIEKDETIQAKISKRIVSSLKYQEFVRVKVGSVGNELIAAPLNRGAASQMSMVRADGLLVIPQNSEGYEASDVVNIKLLKKKEDIYKTLLCVGSHDVLLDIVTDIMEKKYEDVSFSSTHVGSTAGLMALKRNETMIVPTHLLDEETGVYNIPILKTIFEDVKKGDKYNITLIKGFKRTQGIVVKKGNPLNIKTINDLKNGRFVNRQRGSGTRVLFDYLLKKNGIESNEIDGYDKEMATHMAVCSAVYNDEADFCIAIKPTANTLNLDFIEIGEEEYDFALWTKDINDYKVSRFIDVIKSKELHMELDKLTGYKYDNVGEIINI